MEESEKEKKNLQKILLMGKAKVGKSSMRSIIFANQAPKDTFILGLTNEVAESRLKFMGHLYFNLFDCGGQEDFVKQYLDTKKEAIFTNVAVLIFVVEASNYNERNEDDNINDIVYFSDCIKALEEYSPEAKVFGLIHKMDMVPEFDKENVFKQREKELKEKSGKFEIKCYPTSIWEHSLYAAWSQITSELISNRKEIKASLQNFATACNAEEVILFEKNSFISSAYYSKKELKDEQRFEKISHVIKKFKLSCFCNDSNIKSMVMRTNFFVAYLDDFTPSTYIMIVLSNKKVNLELLKLNIALARNTFIQKMGETND